MWVERVAVQEGEGGRRPSVVPAFYTSIVPVFYTVHVLQCPRSIVPPFYSAPPSIVPAFYTVPAFYNARLL